MEGRLNILAAFLLCLLVLPGRQAHGVTFKAAADLTVSGNNGTVPDPDLEVKGFSVFGGTGALTHISTAAGNAVLGGAAQLAGAMHVAGGAVFAGNAFFASSITAHTIAGLAAPVTANSVANKTYVDSHVDNCATGSAGAADMVAGKTADLNCDGSDETGTLPVMTLDPASNTVSAGYYSATTLSAADGDLAVGNIKSGVSIFGITGTYSVAPPAPAAGGTWLLVPGDASLGTRDFYVQKYEAKNVGGVPTSQPAGTPWVSISQVSAGSSCEALGPGYHLITMPEALTISRNIENNAWNWTGGSVGSGGLWRGHTDNSPANALAADVTGDPDDDPYVGTGDSSPSIEKRVHQLSSGQYIWDWSGNVWEWVGMTCMDGTGAGYWYNLAGWAEWSDGNLADYEKGRAGPAGAYTSAQNAGQYYGCTAAGNVGARGGDWSHNIYAGPFAFKANDTTSTVTAGHGFRCAR